MLMVLTQKSETLLKVSVDFLVDFLPTVIIEKFLEFLKGVLHPMPVFGLFLNFSQKLQHIGYK